MDPQDDRSNNNDNDAQNLTESLIDEAINRILLDIVVRGHGDRLIGRWSRLQRVQSFLEQVPYMLDRINQLHLACMRAEVSSDVGAAGGGAQASHLDDRHMHHVHHHRHHHHHHHHQHQHQLSHQIGVPATSVATLATSSLHDFVNLIGNEHHWLVRTRDTIGLTPLHKGVLFNNRPIVEYILDRYPDELAAASAAQHRLGAVVAAHRRGQPNSGPAGAATSTTPIRLIDAQDKYGRTALHYAAAMLGSEARANLTEVPGASPSPAHYSAAHLYGFLLAKGASATLRDFRGKTAADYLQHPKQARAKNVIHLANKLNASYQANVLSRTLRAASAFQQNPILSARHIDKIDGSGAHNDLMQTGDQVGLDEQSDDDDDDAASVIEVDCDRGDDLDMRRDGQRKLYGRNGRESMSLSCNDLRQEPPPRVHHHHHHHHHHHQRQQEDDTLNESKENISPTISLRSYEQGGDNDNDNSSTTDVSQPNLSEALKQLISDRCARPVLDASTKQSISKALRDGTLGRINELIFDGYGLYLLHEAPTTCWSQKCKRFIERLVPNMLERTDKLHESIAANDSAAAKTMIQSEPQLARIRRPYKRAFMSSIHVAAAFNRRSMVQYLIDKFPEMLVQRDSRGATCLHWAARSLRSDRLFCWLVDNYGSQLEHLRDWRSKLAADYRQAAIRMRTNADQVAAALIASSAGVECDSVHRATFSSSGQTLSPGTSDAEAILNKVQRQADELHFDVAKTNINKRPSTYLRPTPSKSPSRCTNGNHHTGSTRPSSRLSQGAVSTTGAQCSIDNNISDNRDQADASQVKIEIDTPSKSLSSPSLKDKHKGSIGGHGNERLTSDKVADRTDHRKRSPAPDANRPDSVEGNSNLSQQRQSEQFSEQVITNELPKLYLSDGLDSDELGLRNGFDPVCRSVCHHYTCSRKNPSPNSQPFCNTSLHTILTDNSEEKLTKILMICWISQATDKLIPQESIRDNMVAVLGFLQANFLQNGHIMG